MEIAPLTAAGPAAAARPAADDGEAASRKAAESFEAAFLAEMLRYTGVNAMPSGFGGGAGEEAFSSFLTNEYARLLAERGGIGISEQVFRLLEQRTEGR